MVNDVTDNSSLTDIAVERVGVLGASSLVGASLLPLLSGAGLPVLAFSRSTVSAQALTQVANVEWRQLGVAPGQQQDKVPLWICVAPIWVLPSHFALLKASGVRRVVALSSTSRFTKNDSSDLQEQEIASRLAAAESQVQAWAGQHGVEWVILRPTLIYGLGRDKNIAEIARFSQRFGFFPLFGKASGLREPIHMRDVAGACVSALQAPQAANCAYNISGGETLTYRVMVSRVFSALGRPVRTLTVPLWFFSLAVTVLRCLPRYRKWTSAMAERMNQDLVFDHSQASRDFGFSPQVFVLAAEDVAAS